MATLQPQWVKIRTPENRVIHSPWHWFQLIARHENLPFFVINLPFFVINLPFFVINLPFYVINLPFYVINLPFYVIGQIEKQNRKLIEDLIGKVYIVEF